MLYLDFKTKVKKKKSCENFVSVDHHQCIGFLRAIMFCSIKANIIFLFEFMQMQAIIDNNRHDPKL